MVYVGTVDQGRLHIGLGKDYQGSINSYNNCLTKLFASLFGKTVDLQIDGQVYVVNKKSYQKFLSCHDVHVASLNELNSEHMAQLLPKVGQFMRHALTPAKTHRLGKALIEAICANNVHGAEKLLAQGADVDRKFWLTDSKALLTFKDDYAHKLPRYGINDIIVSRYNALLLAADFQNREIVEKLQEFNAPQSNGERHTFSREYAGCTASTHYETYSDRVRTVNKYGRTEAVSSSLEIDAVTTRTYHYIDTRKNDCLLILDPQTLQVYQHPTGAFPRSKAWISQYQDVTPVVSVYASSHRFA